MTLQELIYDVRTYAQVLPPYMGPNPTDGDVIRALNSARRFIGRHLRLVDAWVTWQWALAQTAYPFTDRTSFSREILQPLGVWFDGAKQRRGPVSGADVWGRADLEAVVPDWRTSSEGGPYVISDGFFGLEVWPAPASPKAVVVEAVVPPRTVSPGGMFHWEFVAANMTDQPELPEELHPVLSGLAAMHLAAPTPGTNAMVGGLQRMAPHLAEVLQGYASQISHDSVDVSGGGYHGFGFYVGR